jgi:hypothetical protein
MGGVGSCPTHQQHLLKPLLTPNLSIFFGPQVAYWSLHSRMGKLHQNPFSNTFRPFPFQPSVTHSFVFWLYYYDLDAGVPLKLHAGP